MAEKLFILQFELILYMKYFLYLTSFCFVIISACSSNVYKATNRSYKKQVKNYAKLLREYPVKDSAGLQYADNWVGTTNFTMRRPNFVVIHHTAQDSCEQTLRTFTFPRTAVSAHYVICEDGTVHHMLNDLLRAHHAGLGKWGNVSDMNSDAASELKLITMEVSLSLNRK